MNTTAPTRILLVDDEPSLREPLAEYLARQGFVVSQAEDAAKARALLLEETPDLVLVDIMMPGEDGLSLCRHLTEARNLPVILLTARGEATDRIVGLEIGADDYVPKPFNARELTARIRAVLRRADAGTALAPERQVLKVDDVVLDSGSRTVRCSGAPVELTMVEFDLLRMLLEAAGDTVPRDTIVERVLGRRLSAMDRSIDVHISRLRRKLGSRASGEERIKSIRSVGYIYTLPSPGP